MLPGREQRQELLVGPLITGPPILKTESSHTHTPFLRPQDSPETYTAYAFSNLRKCVKKILYIQYIFLNILYVFDFPSPSSGSVWSQSWRTYTS